MGKILFCFSLYQIFPGTRYNEKHVERAQMRGTNVSTDLLEFQILRATCVDGKYFSFFVSVRRPSFTICTSNLSCRQLEKDVGVIQRGKISEILAEAHFIFENIIAAF